MSTTTLAPAAAPVHVPAAVERWLAENQPDAVARAYVGRHRGRLADEPETDGKAYPASKVVSPA